jgi:hypothetical protein
VQYTDEITLCLGDSLVKLKCTGRVDGKRCRKKERNMDMNLPPMEVASWWRKDGYETLNEEEEQDSEGSEDEDRMRMGMREQTAQRMRRMETWKKAMIATDR